MDTSAFDAAKKSGMPLVLMEGENLIELQPDGSKKFLKHIPKHNIELPAKFKLK
jgi:hypothetical protein